MDAFTADDLTQCYRRGVFPMAEARHDQRMFLVDPVLRGILPLDGFHLSRRLLRTVRADRFEIRIDSAFGAVVAVLLILLVVSLIGVVVLVAVTHGDPNSSSVSGGMAIFGFIGGLFFYGLLFWMSLALQVKRWHDRDKSGTWVFINLIPFIGWIWSLIECGFLDGTPGPNRFGPSPKGIVAPPPPQPTT